MAMKGWRRIGIFLSVLAFFPLGIFIWMQPSVSESLYDMRLNNCVTVRHYDLEWMDQVHDMDKWHKLDEESNVRHERCMSKALLDYERTNPPSETTRLLIVIAMDLVLIGLVWLIAWGCIAVGRWVHRGFAAN
jgi:hypothetical protein